MTIVQTTSGEIGVELSAAIREAMSRAVAGMPVATYIEEEPPVPWGTISDAGWDLAGLIEDAESADLRDLVEIGRAWGDHLVQLPLMPSLLAKRHSERAAAHDGPVTFAIATRTVEPGHGLVPFGRVPGILIVADLVADGDLVASVDDSADEFAASLRCSVQPLVTRLTPVAAREIAVVAAAEASGIAARALRDAVAFTKQRHQFGHPIGSFQAIKHHLANAHIASELAETAAIWAARDPAASSGAVHESLRESLRSLHRSIQVYGGLGFTWEMGLHYLLRHVVTLRDLSLGALDHAHD